MLFAAASCIDTGISPIQEPQQAFDLSMGPSHLDRSLGPNIVGDDSDSAIILVHLPLVPNLNASETATTGGAPRGSFRNASATCPWLSTPSPINTTPGTCGAIATFLSAAGGIWQKIYQHVEIYHDDPCGLKIYTWGRSLFIFHFNSLQWPYPSLLPVQLCYILISPWTIYLAVDVSKLNT